MTNAPFTYHNYEHPDKRHQPPYLDPVSGMVVVVRTPVSDDK